MPKSPGPIALAISGFSEDQAWTRPTESTPSNSMTCGSLAPPARSGHGRVGLSLVPYTGPAGVYGTLGVPDPQNIPRGRSGAASWTDAAGKFWLFGGLGGLGANYVVDLNDLWEFDPST